MGVSPDLKHVRGVLVCNKIFKSCHSFYLKKNLRGERFVNFFLKALTYRAVLKLQTRHFFLRNYIAWKRQRRSDRFIFGANVWASTTNEVYLNEITYQKFWNRCENSSSNFCQICSVKLIQKFAYLHNTLKCH